MWLHTAGTKTKALKLAYTSRSRALAVASGASGAPGSAPLSQRLVKTSRRQDADYMGEDQFHGPPLAQASTACGYSLAVRGSKARSSASSAEVVRKNSLNGRGVPSSGAPRPVRGFPDNIVWHDVGPINAVISPRGGHDHDDEDEPDLGFDVAGMKFEPLGYMPLEPSDSLEPSVTSDCSTLPSNAGYDGYGGRHAGNGFATSPTAHRQGSSHLSFAHQQQYQACNGGMHPARHTPDILPDIPDFGNDPLPNPFNAPREQGPYMYSNGAGAMNGSGTMNSAPMAQQPLQHDMYSAHSGPQAVNMQQNGHAVMQGAIPPSAATGLRASQYSGNGYAQHIKTESPHAQGMSNVSNGVMPMQQSPSPPLVAVQRSSPLSQQVPYVLPPLRLPSGEVVHRQHPPAQQIGMQQGMGMQQGLVMQQPHAQQLIMSQPMAMSMSASPGVNRGPSPPHGMMTYQPHGGMPGGMPAGPHPVMLNDAMSMLSYGAHKPAVAYVPREIVVRISAKLFNCTPDMLPPNIQQVCLWCHKVLCAPLCAALCIKTQQESLHLACASCFLLLIHVFA